MYLFMAEKLLKFYFSFTIFISKIAYEEEMGTKPIFYDTQWKLEAILNKT